MTAWTHAPAGKWYEGITRRQWTVLLIASLGWIFDTFEGQVYVSSMNEAMPDLLSGMESLSPARQAGRLAYYNNIAFGAFLLGGAVGGIVFGILGDRLGRVRTLMLTIAMYSAFTFFSAFSSQWWHLAGFRFLVAMGVGGEWAVAAALVAEAFPQRARAWSLAIFHASSVTRFLARQIRALGSDRYPRRFRAACWNSSFLTVSPPRSCPCDAPLPSSGSQRPRFPAVCQYYEGATTPRTASLRLIDSPASTTLACCFAIPRRQGWARTFCYRQGSVFRPSCVDRTGPPRFPGEPSRGYADGL